MSRDYSSGSSHDDKVAWGCGRGVGRGATRRGTDVSPSVKIFLQVTASGYIRGIWWADRSSSCIKIIAWLEGLKRLRAQNVSRILYGFNYSIFFPLPIYLLFLFFPLPYIPVFFEFFVEFYRFVNRSTSCLLPVFLFFSFFPLLLVSENLNSADIIASPAILHNFPRFPRPWPSEPAASESS